MVMSFRRPRVMVVAAGRGGRGRGAVVGWVGGGRRAGARGAVGAGGRRRRDLKGRGGGDGSVFDWGRLSQRRAGQW